MTLTLPDGTSIDHVEYSVTGGPGPIARFGDVRVDQSRELRFRIGDLPVGSDYRLVLAATTSDGVVCAANQTFSVANQLVNALTVRLACRRPVAQRDDAGDLAANVDVVDGGPWVCPAITGISVLPLDARRGESIFLEAAVSSEQGVSFEWSGGLFEAPQSAATNYTCTYPGVANPTLTISRLGCAPVVQRVQVSCADDTCADCLELNCGAYQTDFDVFETCVRNPDPTFAQLCTDAYVCSLASADRCADDLARGPASCFCGLDRTIDQCLAPPSPTTGPAGACIAEWEAATGCAQGDVTCVSARFSNIERPSGTAVYAIGCMVQGCATRCGRAPP